MLYAKIKKRSKSESSLKEAAACSVIKKCITIVVGELSSYVYQRKIVQVERRGNQFTMPRRRRFKPRKDCVAILGKLSSLYILSFSFYYIYIPSNLPLSALCFFSLLRLGKECEHSLLSP